MLIRRQFPDVACARIEPLGEGWDFFVFRVDATLAFRFPKKAIVDACIECELAVLDRLPRELPLAVPRPLYRGQAGGGFPWRFWGYRLIEGESLLRLDVPPSKRAAIAAQIADFLSVLHATDGGGLPPSPWNHHETPWEDQARTCLDASRTAYSTELWRRCDEYLMRAPDVPPYSGEAKLVHCDLWSEHILVDPVRFEATGIIDWGDCNLGDPAGDFVGLWIWGGDDVLDAAIRRYDGTLDADAPRRIRHHGTLIAMQDVYYGVEAERREIVAAGIATLARELLR